MIFLTTEVFTFFHQESDFESSSWEHTESKEEEVEDEGEKEEVVDEDLEEEEAVEEEGEEGKDEEEDLWGFVLEFCR